jgi:hypothetical protein
MSASAAALSLEEPRTRGTVLLGFRTGALAMWGEEGLREIARRLPEDARASTMDDILLPTTWYPVRHVMAWHVAVWEGPAQGIDSAFCKWIDHGTDFSFGRIRKVLVGFASTERVVQRAPDIWKHQQSHGLLRVTLRPGGGGAVARLTGHPLAQTALSRRAFAEACRYIASLTRGGEHVRESHGLEPPETIVIRLTWRGTDSSPPPTPASAPR